MNTATRALLTVAASALLFCFLGGIIGVCLGKFAPGYYRAVFTSGDLPTFDPVQVGLGLGITQGFVGGIIVGCLIVLSPGNALAPLRKGIKQFLYKHRRLLLFTVSGVVILLTFMGWQLRKLGRALSAHAYTTYVAGRYMPAQRRLTGKWPKDLEKLSHYVKAEKDYSRTNESLNSVLEFHRNSFERFEAVRGDRKSCTYRLYLKGFTVKCESVVNKSGFDDGDCTYEQE
jgi:hypothetical protein